MKAGEIIRIIIFAVLGLVLMFWIQPLIYTEKFIRVSDYQGGVQNWVGDNYIIGAGVVFAASLVATLMWYFFTAKAQTKGVADVARWQVMWWLLLLLPVLSTIVAVFFINTSNMAQLSLAGLFIFDSVVLLFWLPTATSSPGSFKYLPPGAGLLRRLVGS